MIKILISCVNYYNSSEVIAYVNEVNKQTVSSNIHIVVTDNSDNKKEFSNLEKGLKDIKNVSLYNANMNLGYIHGINYGIEKYIEKEEVPEWIVISNTDIKYVNNTFYEKLLVFYPDGYNCVLAPSIFSTLTNSYQNPQLINRYKKLKMRFFMFIYKHNFIELCFNQLNNIKNKYVIRKKSLINNMEVYSGHGACLILNKSYFFNGGDLCYGSFLFGEELYIAEITRLIGGKVYFDNRLKVFHNEHSTINKQKRSALNKFYYESMSYLFKKFY